LGKPEQPSAPLVQVVLSWCSSHHWRGFVTCPPCPEPTTPQPELQLTFLGFCAFSCSRRRVHPRRDQCNPDLHWQHTQTFTEVKGIR
jgi:hypothetical protein